MGSPVPDPEIGATFERWTVTGPTIQGKHKKVPVTCSCGVSKIVDKSNLLKGLSRSCGCLSKETTSAIFKKHGKRGSPVYAVWNMMKQRCNLPTNKQYADYGGRGIKVDPTWNDFENFYRDMGDPPFSGAMLERKDTDGDYCKSNCSWATRTQQNRNTRRTVLFDFQGQKLTLAEIAEKTGMNKNTLASRIYGQGLNMEEATTRPLIPNEESGAMAGINRPYQGRIDGKNKY